MCILVIPFALFIGPTLPAHFLRAMSSRCGEERATTVDGWGGQHLHPSRIPLSRMSDARRNPSGPLAIKRHSQQATRGPPGRGKPFNTSDQSECPGRIESGSIVKDYTTFEQNLWNCQNKIFHVLFSELGSGSGPSSPPPPSLEISPSEGRSPSTPSSPPSQPLQNNRVSGGAIFFGSVGETDIVSACPGARAIGLSRGHRILSHKSLSLNANSAIKSRYVIYEEVSIMTAHFCLNCL